MMIIIDRFEGKIAVLEYEKKFWNIPRTWLPDGAKEGDVVVMTVVVDEGETTRRKDEIKRKMDDLFK